LTQNPDLFKTFFEAVSTSLKATKDAELMQCVYDVIIRIIRWMEDLARMGGGKHTRFWWKNPKRPLAKPKRRGNIKMDLEEI